MAHGKRNYHNGAVHYWMQRKRIPSALQADDTYAKLNDVRVVLCTCQQLVITVYREDRRRTYRNYGPGHRNTVCECCGREVA